jgi:alkanesulfonate monooxygenase SsuD/methylene tetrahydromethanopterin reductase-like flavin-dependent oxidoreductase (luciferase family)
MTTTLEYGAHLPLIDFGAPVPPLREYARVAEQLGFRYVCANDHLLFQRPWLDGLTALAALAEEQSTLRLATSIALPVVRAWCSASVPVPRRTTPQSGSPSRSAGRGSTRR